MKKALLLIAACVVTALITLSFKGNEEEAHDYVTLTFYSRTKVVHVSSNNQPYETIKSEKKPFESEEFTPLLQAINKYEVLGYKQIEYNTQYGQFGPAMGFATLVVMQK